MKFKTFSKLSVGLITKIASYSSDLSAEKLNEVIFKIITATNYA